MIPEDEHLDSPKDYDVTKPRIVPYKNIWRVANCVTRVVNDKTQEVSNERVKFSPRPRPIIILRSAGQLRQDEAPTRLVQERRETESQNKNQEETRSPFEEKEHRCKDGDQDETRSVVQHREADSPNEDREVTESSDEMHRDTDTGKEAELEPQIETRKH